MPSPHRLGITETLFKTATLQSSPFTSPFTLLTAFLLSCLNNQLIDQIQVKAVPVLLILPWSQADKLHLTFHLLKDFTVILKWILLQFLHILVSI